MIGLEFRVVPPEVDESLGPAEQAEGYVTRLAREKATTVAGRERGAVVLAADTTVVLRGTIFGKPANPEEAAEMLRQLEGRKHQVMTAVAVALDRRVEHALDVTDVTFRPLTDAQIAAYLATGEPLDKAGAYAIQGKGAALVEGVRGDLFGGMGPPHNAMIASPMNLSSVPPCSNTSSTISVKYSVRSVAMLSGLIVSDIGVKPRMSEKKITTGRFSLGSRPASCCCAMTCAMLGEK